ncbi:cytochrome C [Ammoniphilus oxalaticus]|uniref:Cytochrome C n=1 Tax=Ammoniphilus oxalaticus TaxID=66863 RepID=A0A419SKE7_9BACL|nr:cytochrome c [Ammoniphilus oxalaticus]RKD24409.1 cytochrome C [Ammoniphilus oxalaticus]
MGKNIGIFFLAFAIAFGAGYLFFKPSVNQDQTATEQPTQPTEPTKEQAGTDTANSSEGEILVTRGCISCHAVSALGLEGANTGPDLSQSYVNVPDKHGVSIEEFLINPTTAVMSSVLGGNPLTDEEREAVLEALRLASEK